MYRKAICIAICAALLLVAFPRPHLQAAQPALHLEQARTLALSQSKDIEKTRNEIVIKNMKYIEAVRGIQAKVKNLRSFRYTPLLSFKFPQKLDLVEEYDLQIKPLTLQTEITTLQHRLNDQRAEVAAEVSKQYVQAYTLQEKIRFTEEMLTQAEDELVRGRARLVTGDARQNDVDIMEASIQTLTGDLSLLLRNFESAKKELSDQIGLDVTTGYMFTNPLQSISVERNSLDAIIDHTLLQDQTYYEAKMAVSTARMNLDGYESLMRSQYGGKMDAIQTYVNTVRQGGEIDKTAFKKAYDEMLKSFDKPWDKSIRILFFTFTMEWFKGEISGTRYIEDEMYALYTACLDYQMALSDRNSAEKALRKEVESTFEALITARNAARSLTDSVEDSRGRLDRLVELNRQGKADYGEVRDQRDSYQELQMEALEALAVYTELLYDFDRLTCGAITGLMTGAGLELQTGAGADSAVDRPHYYIYTDIAELVFVFGVDIPDDYEPAITDYEIWYEGTQLGERTPVDSQLRHLALDYGETSQLTVRVYDGEEYIDECVIETTVPRDVLNLKGATAPPPPEDRIIGTYTVTAELDGAVGTSALSIAPDPVLQARYYSLSYGENGIYTSDLIPAEERFHYLTIMIASLDDVTLLLYGSDRQPLAEAYFNQNDRTLRAIPEEN